MAEERIKGKRNIVCKSCHNIMLCKPTHSQVNRIQDYLLLSEKWYYDKLTIKRIIRVWEDIKYKDYVIDGEKL